MILYCDYCNAWDYAVFGTFTAHNGETYCPACRRELIKH